MDESIKIAFINKKGHIDLKPLIDLMEVSKIKFVNCVLDGPFAMATHLGIYMDVDNIVSSFNSNMIWFVVLHEMAHFRRIQKMGKDKVLEMFSLEDFDMFSDHIINEEIIADRY